MKKRISVILAAILLVTAAVGTTVAFLVDKTPSVENAFYPTVVTCQVLESFDAGANVKQNVSVQNTGDVFAYIRTAVVVTWVSKTSGSTYGGAPLAGTDYTVTMGPDGWVRGTDGFYYCTAPVAAGDKTPTLLETVAPVEGRAPEGYVLSVQIVASAIQAEPAQAVLAAWSGVTVHDDGSLSPN